MESLERMQVLHADLVAFTESRLQNIDRLWQELDASIQEFRDLLDNAGSSETQVKAFREGKIEVDGQEFLVNEEFRHLSVAIGSTLNIEEEKAAQLIIQTQASGVDQDEHSIISDVVVKYHDRRDLLLQNLRLVLAEGKSDEHNEAEHQELQLRARSIIYGDKQETTASRPHQTFAAKCLQTMQNVEKWQLTLSEQIQSKAVLSQARGQAFYITLEYQRSSLFKQHEALGAILCLVYANHDVNFEDLIALQKIARQWQRLDFSLVHYFPALSAAYHKICLQQGFADPSQAQGFQNEVFKSIPEAKVSTAYRPMMAALEMWWLAAYSGMDGVDQQRDSVRKREDLMSKTLADGGLQFMLAICSQTRKDQSMLTNRYELLNFLLEGNSIDFEGVEPTSSYFVTLLMESFESFAEAWISNLPDSIRQLKSEEDKQRLQAIISSPTSSSSIRDGSIHLQLESFLILIAFAFDERSDASDIFWSDKDSNCYGFLQWASRRQTVPRVGAFCEMLSVLAQGEQNARHAHTFLLEAAISIPNSRGKKLPSLSYEQIIAELEFYSRKIHETPQNVNAGKPRDQKEPEFNESESPLMLASYLRLFTHLCQEGPLTRDYIVQNPDHNISATLLTLASGSIPTYLRACVFELLAAFLADGSVAVFDHVWQAVERWTARTHDRSVKQSAASPNTSDLSLKALLNTLSAVGAAHDQSDAFVKLLCGLTRPGASSRLPFPPNLGSPYRSIDIVPYVDFVASQLTPIRIQTAFEESDESSLLRYTACLNFLINCVHGFDEAYAVQPARQVGDESGSQNVSDLYCRQHPFARAMQWIFSLQTNKALFELLQKCQEGIENAVCSDAHVLVLVAVLELFNQVLAKEAIFNDVVQSKLADMQELKTPQSSGTNRLEDSMVARPDVVSILCQYAASEHIDVCLKSLKLLEGLSSSSRFQHHLVGDSKLGSNSRQMVDMLGPGGQIKLKNVSEKMAAHFDIDERDLEQGPECTRFLIINGILDFFNACLSTQRESPNLAHLFLGFDLSSSRLISSKTIEQGTSMLDKVISLASLLPDYYDGALQSWLLHIKMSAFVVLQNLWSIQISSQLTLMQLRRSDFLITQMQSQPFVAIDTVWDEFSILDENFWFSDIPQGLADFLIMRSALYEYITVETRDVQQRRMMALQEKYSLALKGQTNDSQTASRSMLDLFDFADVSSSIDLRLPQLKFFDGFDFEAYRQRTGATEISLYDVERLKVSMFARQATIINEQTEAGKSVEATPGNGQGIVQKASRLSTNTVPFDENDLQGELDVAVAYCLAQNRYEVIGARRLEALDTYSKMVIGVIENCPMDTLSRSSVVLKTFQCIMPKLDACLSDASPETASLVSLADNLLLTSSAGAQAAGQGTGDVDVSNKLFQLFRICCEGVISSDAQPELRSMLYSICSQYLARLLSEPVSQSAMSAPTLPTSRALSSSVSIDRTQSNAMDTVRSCGTPLFSLLCDDADDGLDTNRMNALSFLTQLVNLCRLENSTILLDYFIKTNILEILLEPVKNIARAFQQVDPSSRPALLNAHNRLSILLLTITCTKKGAQALFTAGLITCLRESQLFAADPDLGIIDVNSTYKSMSSNDTTTRSDEALRAYFSLLANCLRLFLAAFISAGAQNERLIAQVRNFLSGYRNNMVGLFKRAAGLGLSGDMNTNMSINGGGIFKSTATTVEERKLRISVDGCVNSYIGLAVASGFLEYEEESGLGGNIVVGGLNGFSASSYRNGGSFT